MTNPASLRALSKFPISGLYDCQELSVKVKSVSDGGLNSEDDHSVKKLYVEERYLVTKAPEGKTACDINATKARSSVMSQSVVILMLMFRLMGCDIFS